MAINPRRTRRKQTVRAEAPPVSVPFGEAFLTRGLLRCFSKRNRVTFTETGAGHDLRHARAYPVRRSGGLPPFGAARGGAAASAGRGVPGGEPAGGHGPRRGRPGVRGPARHALWL